MPNPRVANPRVAERAPWRSTKRGVAGVCSLIEMPTDSCHFFCTPGNPCVTPLVTRGEGSFRYQGVSTRGGLATRQVCPLEGSKNPKIGKRGFRRGDHPNSNKKTLGLTPVRFGSVTVRAWDSSSGSGLQFQRFLSGKVFFSLFQFNAVSTRKGQLRFWVFLRAGGHPNS